MKKILAVGIILLFIGVAVAPSINLSVVQASTDDDLVEVTTQACGIKGYGNTTVKLTREQYQDLEQYLVEFRARLNQTTTREEAVPLFKDAVVELDKYGLLPRGMSVERAQKLVLGVESSEKNQKSIQKFLDSSLGGSPNNTFCLVAGIADSFWSINFMTLISGAAFTASSALYAWFPKINYLIYPMLFISVVFLAYSMLMKPFHIFSRIIFPFSKGTIYSIGVSGLYKITGQFDGEIRGFMGIRILKIYWTGEYSRTYGGLFLGSAVTLTASPNFKLKQSSK